jgi:hypothetical protein
MAREADLLPVSYFHVVFALPAEIAPIAYQNKALVYDLPFRMAAETLLSIAAKYVGTRIGATAVLHSWGSAMTHHRHVHMIVPGAGISLGGTRWVRCKPGFLLPVRVLSRLFRRGRARRCRRGGTAGFFGEIEDLRRRQALAAYLLKMIVSHDGAMALRWSGRSTRLCGEFLRVDQAVSACLFH